MRPCAAIAVLAIGISACASPEAGRQRGSGAGADVGNRPALVKMHEGSRPYWKTPVRQSFKAPPLDAAEQARRLSLSKAAPASHPSSSGGTDR